MKKTDMKRIVLLLTTALWFAAGSVYGQNTPDAYNQKGSEALGKKKFAEAFSWFMKSAEAGDAYGQYQLAFCYRNGEGVSANEVEAIRWFRASANGGCQYAYNPLGRMLEKSSPNEAFSWYKKSADTGDMVGQYNLAMCYINGTGTDFNDAEAKKLFEKSATQGYQPAKEKQALINNSDFWKRKPVIDFFDLPSEVTTPDVKFEVKIKAENGRVKKTYVYLNGDRDRSIIPVKEDGYDYSWEQTIKNLHEGQNTIRVEATNRAGTGSKEFVVNYRAIQKAVVTWTPETTTYDPQFPLKATISSESNIESVTLTLNNGNPINIHVNGNGSQKIIEETLSLIPGNNRLKLSVTNSTGTTIEERDINYIKREKRLALVIGNSNYSVGSSLKNPINDATDIKAKLSSKSLGFDVIFGTDADKLTMRSKVEEFCQRAQNYDVALFFYAGHGMQSQSKNFLIPVTADIKSEADIEFEGISADWVLKKLNESRCKAKIIFLDACRNNPYERSWYRGDNESGLAQMKAPKGTFIGYSTGPGEVAGDGKGRNSPFTEALLKALDVENLELKALFDKVGLEVQTNTGQTPWMQSMFYDKFYFNKK